jgi:hypothetical protein
VGDLDIIFFMLFFPVDKIYVDLDEYCATWSWMKMFMDEI